MMRRINFPLLLGCIIMILLIMVALYPGLFTSKDPLFEETRKYIEYKEKGEWVEIFGMNPMPPNKDNVLGTDDAGRDIYARLIYGTRNTLKLALLIAVFRMLIALPLGLAAGMGIGLISGLIRIFNTYFTAIPMLLFSFIVLNIGYFRNLHMDKSILSFAIVLTIVGWAKLAGMIEDSTKRIMDEDFIEGEIAVGKTKFQIAYQNILPHLIPTSISLFFKEMGLALFLIAQLAVLYVFVGVARPIKDFAFKANYEMILEPEWGGTLSRIAINVRKFNSVYWMTFYPILVFSIAIIAINLTGEGLRIEFQKRESRIISFIRKAYYSVSPRLFISQIKNFKKYYKPVMIKTIAILGIIAYFLIPWKPSPHKFDLDQAKIHIQDLISEEYEGRVTGTKGGYLAGEYIIDTLEGYGYVLDTLDIPLTTAVEETDSSEETIVPEILAPVLIESGEIKLTDDNGNDKTYHLHKDFTIMSVNRNIFMDMSKNELNYRGFAADVGNLDNIPESGELFAINQRFPHLNKYVLMSQSRNELLPQSKLVAENGKSFDYDIEFVVNDWTMDNNYNSYVFATTTIIPFDELKKDLETGYREVEINLDYPKVPEYPGRNITAFLPGKDRTKEDPGELIIIGASYNGVFHKDKDRPHVMTAAPTAIALEIARKLSLLEEPLQKSIKFIFWDNEFETFKYSPLEGSGHYNLALEKTINMALTHGYYYIDINYPGYNEDKYLNLITLPAQRADGNNYLIGLGIENRLKEMDVKYRRFHHGMEITQAMTHMRLNALTSIGIGNPSTGGINSSMDSLDNINYERMEDIGQIVLDTLTMKSRIMEHKAIEKENGHD